MPQVSRGHGACFYYAASDQPRDAEKHVRLPDLQSDADLYAAGAGGRITGIGTSRLAAAAVLRRPQLALAPAGPPSWPLLQIGNGLV